MRRAAGVALLALAVCGAGLALALAGHLGGKSAIPPLACALLGTVAVSVLLAARRRAAEDPGAGRALVVLGAGVGFAALASTTLLWVVYSIS